MLAIVGITYGLGKLYGSNHAQQERYQEYKDTADTNVRTNFSNTVLSERVKYKKPCYQPEGNDESDLCAQWHAAIAAEDSASWAKWSFWIAVAGILGLLANLFYTREAVRVARAATEDAGDALAIAERNADAAMRHVEVSQKTAEQTLRAYVDFGHASLILDEERSGDVIIVGGFKVKAVNYGSTPASNVFLHTSYEVLDAEGNGTPLGNNDIAFAIISPKDSGVSNQFFNIAKPVWIKVIRREYSVICSARITYDDVFGNEHVAYCQYESRGFGRAGYINGTRHVT